MKGSIDLPIWFCTTHSRKVVSLAGLWLPPDGETQALSSVSEGDGEISFAMMTASD